MGVPDSPHIIGAAGNELWSSGGMESDSTRRDRRSYITQGLLVRDLCSGGRCLEGSDADLEYNPSPRRLTAKRLITSANGFSSKIAADKKFSRQSPHSSLPHPTRTAAVSTP